jgi:hypothetical protein
MPPALAERVAAVEQLAKSTEEKADKVAEHLDRLQFWMLCTFGATVLGLILTALNMGHS